MKTIWNGITKENALFCLLLGLCPALAVTTKFENAYLMGICVLIVVTLSNTIISIFKKVIPKSVKVPTFILIIGTIVTILELLLERYIPKLYETLGIYLPLIVVNCIVLGRAINVASKSSVFKSFKDGIGIGLGYTIALMIIGLFREVLGTGIITLMDSTSKITGYRAVYKIFDSNILPVNFFITPAGAFMSLGIILGVINYITKRGNNHESN